ncbi:MAG: Translation initiation factor IF-3 [Candidatus Daviesbacteria bacterium GW2011_GWB1_39_5]|uniref:Translation initiation factor IF-3 n=1 Tax=Candidatus Daviesbacteria bacterium GW2011_GWC2_40_12 TaxID=1618431 RepID=A0A0G0TT26_9BACT|nr:MAG: Translation initiation factor IF-3 [Candidatus Daviesbacteria bacterium GW2011_GWF2_38_7]KKR16675.1 MAG: Translation initiation factor IF-3 [Candidatus Daviesbacteria bacterium GW2011_GWA2_39_33]KKR25141.1 MAG: Translation initiation factor IF-3 [Candidatus Daviesbacteria bacterium GW2011_GWB1_39_5]KKR41052.1 MAG: Translation initiation factor IF-3 [Candidatus Daviesbacteria bacterium GW2011_GWC2_40_12]
MEKAKELGLDLIEIAPNADPPVAKITDFQKFRYEENKKERASKKGASAGDLKELWLSPRIAEHDLNVRLARTEEFLKGGHKVKLTVKFKGREMAHQELGYKVLQEAINLLGEKAAIEREPKMEGRKLSMIVGKGKGKQNAETKNE